MIEFNHVHFSTPTGLILNNIHLTLSEKKVGIIGANGSGKSTLIKLIKGLLKPSKGHIQVLGNDIQKVPKNWHRQIGYVFQDPDHQIIMPLVEDDLSLTLKKSGFNKQQISEKIELILEKYNLKGLRERNTYQLSGGEKQLLALAGVLMMDPQIILFDEPTTLLDLRNKNRIVQIIEQLTQSVVVVTHDFDLLRNFDRVIVLEKGCVIADDVPARAWECYVKTMA